MSTRRTLTFLAASALGLSVIASHTALAAGGAPATSQANPVGAAFKRVSIMDNITDPSHPVRAGGVEIPADWQLTGGIGWDRSGQCVSNYLRMHWRATSTDGTQFFEAMPGYTWQLEGNDNPMNPCGTLRLRSAREFLETVMRQRHADARIVEYRNRPDLAQAQAASSPVSSMGSARHEAGQLIVAFGSAGGERHESYTAMLTITELQGSVVIGAPGVYLQRAPAHRLDFALGDRIRDSMTADASWVQQGTYANQQALARISQEQSNRIAMWHSTRMGQINARGAAERSQIAMQTSREVAQIYSDGWKQSMATDERMQRGSVEAIRGVNTYRDHVSGDVVEGSVHYDQMLRTDGGDYLSTNDPNFRPWGTEELEQIR